MSVLFKLQHSHFKRFPAIFLAVILCGILSSPVKAEAGWLENQINNIQSKLNNIVSGVSVTKSRVTNVYNKIIDAAGTISDDKIQNLIVDMKTMLQSAVEAQQNGMNAFMAGGNCILNDGTPCGLFREDLIDLVHLSRALSNKILTLHNIPGLDLQIEDMGLADLIENLPGRVLLPLYKVVTKAKLFTPELLNALQTADTSLDNLRTVLFIEDFPELPNAEARCTFIDDNSTVFKISANTIKGIGVLLKVLGKLFEALGKTPAGGPNEVDAGIHGYVHATVKTNTLGTIGKILGGISGPMSSISSYVSNKVSSCEDMIRDKTLLANQTTIVENQGTILQAINNLDLPGNNNAPNADLTELMNNQTTIMENQDAIFRGQRETLCAYKNNLPEHCAEFIGNGFDNRGVGK